MHNGWADRIRQRVRELGLTDSATARALDIPQRRFANYVQGTREPDFAMLLRVCQFLRTTPDAILGTAPLTAPQPQDSVEARLEAAVLALPEADRRRALAMVEALAALALLEDKTAVSDAPQSVSRARIPAVRRASAKKVRSE